MGQESQRLWGDSIGQKGGLAGGDWGSKWGNGHQGTGRRARGGGGRERGRYRGLWESEKRGQEVGGKGGQEALWSKIEGSGGWGGGQGTPEIRRVD